MQLLARPVTPLGGCLASLGVGSRLVHGSRWRSDGSRRVNGAVGGNRSCFIDSSRDSHGSWDGDGRVGSAVLGGVDRCGCASGGPLAPITPTRKDGASVGDGGDSGEESEKLGHF